MIWMLVLVQTAWRECTVVRRYITMTQERHVEITLRHSCEQAVCGAGGTSLFTSLRERLEREVGELAAQNAKVKVTSPANTMERRFSVWLGQFLLMTADIVHPITWDFSTEC